MRPPSPPTAASPPAAGPVIAQGRTASVHAWRTGWVLKLFQAAFDRAAVEREARIAQAVRASGLPVPAVDGVVAIGGRFGLVFERAPGVPMSQRLIAEPAQATALGRRLARLHAQMHGLRVAGLPAQRSVLEHRLAHGRAMPPPLWEAAQGTLAGLPPGDSLCHGDFHPGNVLIDDEQAVVIDWADASCGHPAVDVARTRLVLLGEAQRASGRPVADRAVVRRFCTAYVAEYRLLTGMRLEEIDAWQPLVCAARLDEGLDHLAPWLQAQARAA